VVDCGAGEPPGVRGKVGRGALDDLQCSLALTRAVECDREEGPAEGDLDTLATLPEGDGVALDGPRRASRV
jgi:hypothetical protein